MRKLSFFALPLLLLAVTLGAGAEDQAGPAQAPWPVRFSGSLGEFVVYPPHFDQWRNGVLRGHAAVSVQPDGADQPTFGMLWISARARLEAIDRTVYISDPQVEGAEFPAAPDRSADYLAALRNQLAAKSWQVSEQRLESDMAIDRATQQARAQPLNNTPPRIIFTQQPSVLVPIDGTPVLRDVEGTQLLRVVNTRALLLLDRAGGRYYLGAAGRWMSAMSLEGPWSEIRDATGELERARRIAERQGEIDLLEGEAGQANAAAPSVYVATTPTELLHSDGPPEYSPIEGTRLLYVTNTPDRIFLDLRTQRYFVLISGRWYRAADLARGPWDFVPGGQLPADFAMIPPDHPVSGVRASIPGTAQAQEAVIASDAPQIATIRREAARIELSYDGEPEFRPIEGTTLHYAANAPIPVIRVGADAYYALDNGVWFGASSPYGTWSMATYVPAAIYGIPPSSPLHYVTYVRIYHDTAETVDVGYTSGYAGSYVSADHVVVYGSGWYYPPWIGDYWYAAPFTWGYGFSAFYTWWYPWGPPRAVVWRSYPCYRPWWGPWIVVRHGWVRGAVAHPRVAVKPVRDVTRIYDRWDDKVVTHHRSGDHRDQAMHRKPLRPGEGYIVKDGRRFEITPHDDQGRPWRGEDRSSPPPIPGRPPHGKSSQGWGSTTPGSPPAAARPAAQAATSGGARWQATQPSRRLAERDGRPETRAMPAPRALVAAGNTGVPGKRERALILRQPRGSWSQVERDRGIERRDAGSPSRSSMQREAHTGPDRLSRSQLGVPQREARSAPREDGLWDRPQRQVREMPRRQNQGDAREGRARLREFSRDDRS